MKNKDLNVQNKIVKIVGIILLGVFIPISLNLNESDFRTLAIFFLLIFGLVWSEQYEFLFILVLGYVMLSMLLPLALSIRF